jgi:hypothetical protein
MRNLLAPRLLRLPRVRDSVAGSFAGTGLRYPSERGQHRLVGRRATEISLRHAKLTQLQRNAGFVLIRERGAEPIEVSGLVEAERSDVGPSVLVRPDGYIAWAGEAADRGGLTSALHRWTGNRVAARLDNSY